MTPLYMRRRVNGSSTERCRGWYALGSTAITVVGPSVMMTTAVSRPVVSRATRPSAQVHTATFSVPFAPSDYVETAPAVRSRGKRQTVNLTSAKPMVELIIIHSVATRLVATRFVGRAFCVLARIHPFSFTHAAKSYTEAARYAVRTRQRGERKSMHLASTTITAVLVCAIPTQSMLTTAVVPPVTRRAVVSPAAGRTATSSVCCHPVACSGAAAVNAVTEAGGSVGRRRKRTGTGERLFSVTTPLFACVYQRTERPARC